MPFLIDPQLLKAANWRAFRNETYVPGSDVLQKSAVVPPGGGDPAAGAMPPGGDPMGAGAPGGPPPGAPPMDPMAGPPMGGGQMDPAMIQQIVQATLAQSGGGAGGAGAMGPGGKPATKKVDPAILDTKLWQIMKMLALMLEHNQIPIPADLALGPPPDPTQMAAAMADQQTAMAGGAPPADPAAAGGGAPPPSAIAPVEPMQPAMPQDPMAAAGGGAPPGGKQAADARGVGFGQEYASAPQSSRDGMKLLAKKAREIGSYASRTV